MHKPSKPTHIQGIFVENRQKLVGLMSLGKTEASFGLSTPIHITIV